MQEHTFAATLESLEPIREYVREAALEAGLDRSATYNLCLAVDEIATNIVVHGYEEADLQGDIKVQASVDPDKLVIYLRDRGKPYDPSLHHVPDREDLSLPLETRRVGGLGILLARDAVDEFQYDRMEQENVHRFVVLRNRSG